MNRLTRLTGFSPVWILASTAHEQDLARGAVGNILEEHSEESLLTTLFKLEDFKNALQNFPKSECLVIANQNGVIELQSVERNLNLNDENRKINNVLKNLIAQEHTSINMEDILPDEQVEDPLNAEKLRQVFKRVDKAIVTTARESLPLNFDPLLEFFRKRTISIAPEINNYEAMVNANTHNRAINLSNNIDKYRNLFERINGITSNSRKLSLIASWIFMIDNAEEALMHIWQSTEQVPSLITRKEKAAEYMSNSIESFLNKKPREANRWDQAAQVALTEKQSDKAQYIAKIQLMINELKKDWTNNQNNKKVCSYYKNAGKMANDCLFEFSKTFNKNEITNAFEQSSIFWKKSAQCHLDKKELTKEYAKTAAQYWVNVAHAETEEKTSKWKLAAEYAANAFENSKNITNEKNQEISKLLYDAASYSELAIIAAEKSIAAKSTNEINCWNKTAEEAQRVVENSTKIAQRINNEPGFYGALQAMRKDNSLQSSAGKGTDNSRQSVNKKQENINDLLTCIQDAKDQAKTYYDAAKVEDL